MAAKTTTASSKKAPAKKATAKKAAKKATDSAPSQTQTAKKAAAKPAPAKKAIAKKSAPKKAAGSGTTGGSASPKRASRAKTPAPSTIFLPRAVACVDDDNPLMAHGGGGGGFGRCGGEGKGVIIEAIEDAKASILTKVIAFREQYGQEFYITLVADDEVLDEVPLAAYDESCSSTNVHTLIARLAE